MKHKNRCCEPSCGRVLRGKLMNHYTLKIIWPDGSSGERDFCSEECGKKWAFNVTPLSKVDA